MQTISTHIRYIIIILVIFVLISTTKFLLENGVFPNFEIIINYILWSSFYTIPLYIVNGYFYHGLDKRIPENNLFALIKKFTIGVLFSSAISVFIGAILFVIQMMINGKSYDESINWVISSESLPDIQSLVWISASIAFAIYLIRFIIKYQAEKLKHAKQKVVQLSTEHESLKSQIGPHFLFNSLNVLNGLISENPDRAQEFVSELSAIYRYVLEQKDKSLVLLSEELNFSETYMNLVQKRYEDGLTFEIFGAFEGDLKIVPLSLQILLENAIKHNRISSEEPLHIKLEISPHQISISNNLQKKNKLIDSTGKGLQNIIQRYRSFTDQKVEITESATDFTVKLPLLTEKIINMQLERNYTEEEYKSAQKRVEEVQEFYWNFFSYVIVNIFLSMMDLRDGSYDWAFWPLLGWGLGLAFHSIEVFGFFNNQTWKEQMVRKELERRKREQDNFHSNLNP